MLIEEVYRVSWNGKTTIEDRGQSYEVSPQMLRKCHMITKVHSLLIGVGVIFAVLLAGLLGSTSFFGDILMVIIVLALLSVLVNYLSRFVLFKSKGK